MRDINFNNVSPPPQGRLLFIALAVAGAVGAHLLLPGGSTPELATPAELPPNPGWHELASCSQLISLDETKKLQLRDDHKAILRVKQIEPKGRVIEGRWDYDEDAKRYAVTLNSITTKYSVVALPGWSGVCLFVTGDLAAANLNASWISSVGQMDEEFD